MDTIVNVSFEFERREYALRHELAGLAHPAGAATRPRMAKKLKRPRKQ
jgi:hypothetical protein